MRISLFFLFALLNMICAAGLAAQSYTYADSGRPAVNTGTIEGQVRDSVSGELLGFVSITVKELTTGVVSEPDGSFMIAGLPSGRYAIRASFLGYEDVELSGVEVQAGNATAVILKLKPAALLMNEVVVSASGRSQAMRLVPASIGVISKEELRSRNVVTFDQAFDDMPGVVVTRSGGANVQAFSIRGASEVAGGGIGNRVMLLIDGRPALSPESGGALWNLVPVSAIERIEVLRGAYSSLYGSSAMGGVVNVITRKGETKPATRINMNYGAYGPAPKSSGYRNYGGFHALEASHSGRVKRLSYVLDGSWKSDDGHREMSAFDLYNFFGKANWEIKPGHHLQFSANYNQMFSDAPATWLSRRQAYSVADFKKDDFQNRREMSADLYYYAVPSDRVRYSSRLYHYRSFSQFTFDDDPGNDSTNINFGKQIVKSYQVSTSRIGNITQFDVALGQRHYLIAGADVKWDYVLGIPDIYLYGEHYALGVGLYVQDDIKINSKLSATLGGRFDYYEIFGEVRDANFSPKLSLLYQAKPKVAFRALLAQAFRDPPIAERFIKFAQGSGLSFLPNPNLRPERLSLSVELGAKWEPVKGSALDVSLFYNKYNNLISFQQVSGALEGLTFQVVNLREAIMQGLELSYRHRFSDFLSAQLAYTFLDARDISPERFNDALAYKVRHSLGASANTQYGKFSLNVGMRYRSRIEEVFIYPGSEPSAVLVANARLCYRPAEQKTLYFGIGNVNNAQYEELERYRMPGRNFTAGVDISF
jgi:outer membrane receptor protein involved in Fe transport